MWHSSWNMDIAMDKFEYRMRLSSVPIIIGVLILLLISFDIYAQHQDQKNIMVPAFPYQGETLPTITMNDCKIVSSRRFKSDKDLQAFLRLKRNVRKAYPYAVLASVKLREYDAKLASIPEAKRDAYLKKAEKELKAQFEGDLKNLTMAQGRILCRLINRETGMTTYKVIKDYRGGFSAFMWQSLGLLWGNNLKNKYNPSKGEDKMIEEIILQIQDGEV